jgi:hypothetical protein
MDSSVSPKDEMWFLRVCHHILNAVCLVTTRLSDAAATLSYLTSCVCDPWNAVTSSTQHANFMGHVFGILKFPVATVGNFLGYCQQRLGTEINVSVIGVLVGQDSSVGIATRYGLDGPEIESPVGARFSAPV